MHSLYFYTWTGLLLCTCKYVRKTNVVCVCMRSWFSEFLLATSETSSVFMCRPYLPNRMLLQMTFCIIQISLLVTDISLNTLDKFYRGYYVCRSCMVSGYWSGRRFGVFCKFVFILLSADGTIFLWYLRPSLPSTF